MKPGIFLVLLHHKFHLKKKHEKSCITQNKTHIYKFTSAVLHIVENFIILPNNYWDPGYLQLHITINTANITCYTLKKTILMFSKFVILGKKKESINTFKLCLELDIFHHF